MTNNLQVMKFGGTSVGNADCIRRTADIVVRATADSSVIAVVSAMGGVTNRLLEGAQASASGDTYAASSLAETLRQQHRSAIDILIDNGDKRAQLAAELNEIIEEVTSLCHGTALLRELTPRTLDAISSAGERLSARLLASALRELGLKAEAVEATELIVTDNQSGRAEPLMAETRQRATSKLAPLLAEGTVPSKHGPGRLPLPVPCLCNEEEFD